MPEYKDLTEYARHVRRQTAALMTCLCEDLGPQHPTTLKMLALVEEAANIVRENQMEQDQSGSYDLADLHVNTNMPSNSETGWEREI